MGHQRFDVFSRHFEDSFDIGRVVIFECSCSGELQPAALVGKLDQSPLRPLALSLDHTHTCRHGRQEKSVGILKIDRLCLT